MVNGLHLYSTFKRPLRHPKYTLAYHPPIHSHPNWQQRPTSCHARCGQVLSLTNWRQLGVKCLAQGHFDMQTGGAGNQIGDPAISRQPPLPLSHSCPIE